MYKYLDLVVVYYCESSKSQNHETAEAACAAMTELLTRLEKEYVCDTTRSGAATTATAASTPAGRSVIPAILQALRACVQDLSWPVRYVPVLRLDVCMYACNVYI